MRCPTENCKSHIIKKGRLYLKTDRTYVQRYKCITCNKTFLNQDKIERNPKEKMYSTRKDIAELYCMGMSLRDIAKNLGISRNTVMAKFDLISQELEVKFKDYESFNFNSHHEKNHELQPIIVLDEMESYQHTKLKPLSIVVAYDVVNKKVVDIKIATFFPKGRFIHELTKKPHLRTKYELAKRNREDNRSEQIKLVFENVKKYIDVNSNSPMFITDGKASYKTILKEVFQDRQFDHKVIMSKDLVENFIKHNKYGFKQKGIREKASFDSLCAVMRSKISRLRRDSFIHTKKVSNLQKTLFLFMDYWNNSHSPLINSKIFN